MAQAFEVIMDKRQIEEVRRMLAGMPKAWPRVASNAINKTARTVRSKIVKRISSETGVKQKAIREATQIFRASRKSLLARVSVEDKAISLIDMGARQTKKGVSYRAGEGKRVLIRHAFIAKVRGKKGVYRRTGVATRPPWGLPHRHGFPIRKLFGPSILTLLAGEADLEIRAEAGDLLQHYIDQEIGRLLEKRRGAA